MSSPAPLRDGPAADHLDGGAVGERATRAGAAETSNAALTLTGNTRTAPSTRHGGQVGGDNKYIRAHSRCASRCSVVFSSARANLSGTSWLCPAISRPRQCEEVALPEQAINRGHERYHRGGRMQAEHGRRRAGLEVSRADRGLAHPHARGHLPKSPAWERTNSALGRAKSLQSERTRRQTASSAATTNGGVG